MLELLQPKAGEHILDIGAGSGWQTAILADVVSKKTAEGTGVATDSELSLGSIDKYGFIRQNIAQVVLGDGTKGYKNSAPYDKIIASASSEGDVPVLWKRQLKIGGRIVAPVGSSIVVIDKISKLKYTKKEYFGFNFTPLVVS